MIVLTGASGWFGKNALLTLEQRIGPQRLRSELYPVASDAQLVDFGSPLGPIQCYPFGTLSKIAHPTAVLHTAFLKRAKLQSINHAEFVKKNKNITQSIIELINKNPSCPVVSISSGAAAGCDDKSLSMEKDPYAALKHEEEIALSHTAVARMAVVFRVYAASGRFMRVPSIYALGDFIHSALRNKKIKILSEHEVWRSYVHAGDLMALSWNLLLNPSSSGYYKIDACTETLEIGTLAKNVLECLGDGDITREINPKLPKSIYVGDTLGLRTLMQERGIPIKTIKEQILDTINGLEHLP